MKTKTIPLFEKYTVDELSKRTGYKKTYLAQIEDGYYEPTRTFKRKLVAILGESEESLFGVGSNEAEG